MKRRSVKVIKSRLEDVEVGDVVNRNPDAEMGWFTVDAITTLFNGHLQLADVTEQLTVSGDHKDMVGLQLVKEIELDERGLVAPAAPAVVAAAAEIANATDRALGDGRHAAAEVDLALVAELLEDLDVGEAPTADQAATTPDPLAAPPSSRPTMPEGARPVFGSELPETPSYENPVVVPEDTLLPRRSRAA